MPIKIDKVEDPCQECRDRHLKCDDGRPKCKQCTRLGEECHRSKGKPKFRFGSTAKYDQNFSKDQVWLAQAKNVRLQFVDQGPELENYYSIDDVEHDLPAASWSASNMPTENDSNIKSIIADLEDRSPSDQVPPILGNTSASPAPTSIEALLLSSPPADHLRNDTTLFNSDHRLKDTQRSDAGPNQYYVVRENPRPFGHQSSISSPDLPEPVKRRVYAEYQRIEDSNAAYVPADELLSPAIWKEHFVWPNHLTTIQCTCLMRYYIDQLGPWLDIGDPYRTFTLIVPQRARRCPPLLNAIFTVAARHLSCIARYRATDGIVQYGTGRMPRLDEGQAIRYQNASIAYLKVLCNHPEHVQDEDLLAATVILRYYEEFDTSLGGERAETVMRPFQLFVTAQAYPAFLPQLQHGTLDFAVPGVYASMRGEIETYLRSYQHAAFRIALRQECARSFMKQQPIGLDLQTWSILGGFDEAEDFVWADRHLFHLARVLQFCFDGDSRGQQHLRRWEELREFEGLWEENKPFSFAAIHHKQPDKSVGEVLPEIWWMGELYALATQYLELSRILLAVYNPTLPRLGPGAALAQKKTSARIRESVLQLSGISTSLQGCEPALIQACMAIALCGEHISDQLEQKVMLGLLERLQEDHGLETRETVSSLKQSWLW